MLAATRYMHRLFLGSVIPHSIQYIYIYTKIPLNNKYAASDCMIVMKTYLAKDRAV
jgi:hypothetical protein